VSALAEDDFASALSVSRALFERPEVAAYYVAQAKRKSTESRRIEEAERAKREAVEAERLRAKAYDVWALNGGSDECTQFGINDGCKPWCPVFERGQCEIQDENQEIFDSEGAVKMTAPTNLAEALDALAPFLPSDRRLMVMQHRSGNVSVSLYTGDYKTEIAGSYHAKPHECLSHALSLAEADLASKTRPRDAAVAEFGQYFARAA
jgi:hypothetical protein